MYIPPEPNNEHIPLSTQPFSTNNTTNGESVAEKDNKIRYLEALVRMDEEFNYENYPMLTKRYGRVLIEESDIPTLGKSFNDTKNITNQDGLENSKI